MVAILNWVVAAAIGSFAGGALESGVGLSLAIGAIAFIVALAAQGRIAMRSIARAVAAHVPMFPSS